IALDSGGYGPFTISQDVTVAGAPGVYAAMTVPTGNGIDVSVTSASVKISNLRINLVGYTGIGINATAFQYLTIDNCVITGGQHGIMISGAFTSRAMIADTVVRGADDKGFFCQSFTAILRSRAEGCGNDGLYAQIGALAYT